jgi:hypothetical protein
MGDDGQSVNQKHLERLLVFGVIVVLLTAKVLWGYWERDLTSGDTSSYFRDAVRWHRSGEVNIVWSPLYTAYYGMWLSVSENAVVATFLHRFGLIVVSTVLVAWLGLLSLPRVFAFLLVSWWIMLPIHYDTLYEVHLFGAIPVIALGIVSLMANENWRMPFLLGITLVTTMLLRNEYILALGMLAAVSIYHLLNRWRQISRSLVYAALIRHAIVMLFAGLLIGYFYSVSHVKGSRIQALSSPKHTLNMCQVYAFGYHQRNPSWKKSPWTDCSELMSEKFGTPSPSLRQMIIANPGEVINHFLWNLGLSKAGIEVLLFNATDSLDNPDYPPVLIVPVLPSVLSSLTLMIFLAGTIMTFKKSQNGFASIRSDLIRIGPILLAMLVVASAVIITQRPRPSYLLGPGVLFVWLIMTYVWRFTDRYINWNSYKLFLSVSVLILIIAPSFRDFQAYRKSHGYGPGSLNLIYGEVFSHQKRLCKVNGPIVLGAYSTDIANYLYDPCKTHKFVSSMSLSPDAYLNPDNFVFALENMNAGGLIVDPFLFFKYPDLQNCSAMRDALLKFGWSQLSFSIKDDGRCVAVYIKGQ